MDNTILTFNETTYKFRNTHTTIINNNGEYKEHFEISIDGAPLDMLLEISADINSTMSVYQLINNSLKETVYQQNYDSGLPFSIVCDMIKFINKNME
jgi:hypothetical protein